MDSSQVALILAAVAIVGVIAFLIGRWRGREREKATFDELLRQPQSHGYLAEADLAEILRSNLSSDAFKLQYEFQSAAGKQVRADAIVRVGDVIVPIDSKYPLEPFKQVIAAKPDSPFERTASSKFRTAVKAMIDQIASKYIRPDEETLDFALMYIPAEVIYHRAILDEAIVDHAMERSVLLVSPGSLFAYLSVVDRGQRGVKLDERTAEVLGRIDTVRLDLEEFRRTYATLGKHIGSAQRKHEEASTQVDQLQKRLDRTLDGRSEE
jgi:DNA recombination protein RmuC